jgi:hypothetical protein
MATVHFLLVYDLSEERLISQMPYYDVDEALAAYSDCESRYGTDSDKEIVLVGADSIETIMRTHGQYFPRTTEVASPYLVTSK